MSNRPSRPAAIPWALLALVGLSLAGCVQRGQRMGYEGGGVPYDGTDPAAEARHQAPTRYYQPPGPPEDPWGPYIREAAGRYGVPEQWVRAVMRQESAGHEQAVSPVGAMGLMQVMPATYEGLRRRHRLGADPYDPHNNVLAGTAYIREMFDKYGAPGFLAAYNAGPDRVDSYLAGGGPLPDETVNYLAVITPNLGTAVPLSGPLAMYAGGPSMSDAAAPVSTSSLASGCDVNAAFDPDQPCKTLEREATAPTAAVALARAARGGCDAANDPDGSCQPLRGPALAATPAPIAAAAAGWAVQVGAFTNPGLARAVAEGARAEAPGPLGSAALALPPTTPSGGSMLYRARLTNLSPGAATSACAQLNQRQLPCVVVPPAGS